MAADLNSPMTWQEFKALEAGEQHDYLQHLIDTYNATAVSFAEMFHLSANTVRKYLADHDLGVKLSRGSRTDSVRWNEFLGAPAAVEEPVEDSDSQPVSSGMQVCSASMRFCGTIDVDAIATALKRIFDGKTQGEIDISCTIKVQ